MKDTETKKNERPAEPCKKDYNYAIVFGNGDLIDRLDAIEAYVSNRNKARIERLLNVSGAQPVACFVPAVLKENNEQPYLSIAYEAGEASGVRITGLGEDFVVALHDDIRDGKEVTWDEACKLNAPTKKQAALMFAVWGELNAMLQEAGGDRLDDGNYRWTSTGYTDNRAWFYYGTHGSLYHDLKNCSNSVRHVLNV